MVQPHGGAKMYFVVMGNIFAQSLEIQERYDLKGSVIGRTVGEEKLKDLKPTTILKDLDFHKHLTLGPAKRELLLKQLDSDCEFLQRQDIMDYSLLLGIHSKARAIRNGEDTATDTDPTPGYVPFPLFFHSSPFFLSRPRFLFFSPEGLPCLHRMQAGSVLRMKVINLSP